MSEFPKLDNSQGKTSCTTELIKEFTKAIQPIASPLYFRGYNSDNNTHITGPSEKAKQATKPKIPIKIKVELIVVAASKIAPSFLLNTFAPKMDFISFLKSTSKAYCLSAMDCNFSEPSNLNFAKSI